MSIQNPDQRGGCGPPCVSAPWRQPEPRPSEKDEPLREHRARAGNQSLYFPRGTVEPRGLSLRFFPWPPTPGTPAYHLHHGHAHHLFSPCMLCQALGQPCPGLNALSPPNAWRVAATQDHSSEKQTGASGGQGMSRGCTASGAERCLKPRLARPRGRLSAGTLRLNLDCL